MTNLEKIHWAAKLVGLEEPNCLYLAYYSVQTYLIFAKNVEYNKLKEHQNQLFEKGVMVLYEIGGLGISPKNLLKNEK